MDTQRTDPTNTPTGNRYRFLRRTEALRRLYPHEEAELTRCRAADPVACDAVDRVLDEERAERRRDRAWRAKVRRRAAGGGRRW